MKTAKLLIILCVFLATFLVGGMALALEAPALTVTVAGTTVSLSWTSVAGASGYTLYYAPYPKADQIGNIPMGDKTSMFASLPKGSAFYVALQAYNSVGSSGYSNIEHFIISTPPTYTNSLGQTFILLPAGNFTMGSPSIEPGSEWYEKPLHQVTLTQPFYMQQTEVTQAQWEAVMGRNPSYFSQRPSCPVERVSWNDVQEFITKMNARGEGAYSLPTEAQWEYAARAGTNTAFYNGRITMGGCGYDPNLDAIGWYCYNSESKTHPVAQKVPNAWGLYDMSGNVYEWVQDWFENYPSRAVTDPVGPSTGSGRVIRCGSWNRGAENSRSAQRRSFTPDDGNFDIGFRLVLSSGRIDVTPSNLSLSQGQTKTCEISGGTRPYSAVSSDPAVATVGNSGNILYVTGMSTGSATLTVYDSVGDSVSVFVAVSNSLPNTYTNSLGMTFNLLPAGNFTMGSPSDEPGYAGETQHQVTLTQAFYMQTTEVTQTQWETVMGNNPSYFSGCPTCPVEYVSRDDIEVFIGYMNDRGEGLAYSLPTEAQWEYAARAGTSTAFYNGGITELGCGYDPNLDAIGWYCYNSESKTHPVAQKVPNAWGLYDMSGNVGEWCSDRYGSYPSSAVTDPTGPSTGIHRVDRGGSWYHDAQTCRSADRYIFTPDGGYSNLGFRLVLSSGQQ